MTEEILLDASGLSYFYTDRLGVKDISLQLRRGEILGLLGANGAGKSSLLRLLGGVLVPATGRIEILGRRLDPDDHRLRAHIGYQPDHNILQRSLTVDENLRYALGFYVSARIPGMHERIQQTKALCGLQDLGHRLVGSLSKGMLQRANLALAIIHRPDIILLDEPTEGLDPLQIKAVRQLLLSLSETSGIILSSHLLSEIERLCTSVALIRHGRLVYSGPAAALNRCTATEALSVSFETPADPALLRGLDGVTDVQTRQPNCYLIHSRQRNSTTQALLRLANQHGWHITEITQHQPSLEDLFEQVLATDDPAAPVEPGADQAQGCGPADDRTRLLR